jgi:membrane protein YdbS with pleckstrin-like domain
MLPTKNQTALHLWFVFSFVLCWFSVIAALILRSWAMLAVILPLMASTIVSHYVTKSVDELYAKSEQPTRKP